MRLHTGRGPDHLKTFRSWRVRWLTAKHLFHFNSKLTFSSQHIHHRTNRSWTKNNLSQLTNYDPKHVAYTGCKSPIFQHSFGIHGSCTGSWLVVFWGCCYCIYSSVQYPAAFSCQSPASAPCVSWNCILCTGIVLLAAYDITISGFLVYQHRPGWLCRWQGNRALPLSREHPNAAHDGIPGLAM